MIRPGLRRPRGEQGSALVEFTWLAVLLIVPLIWVVTSVFEVQRGTFAATAASRSAARAYALAPDDRVGQQRARAVVEHILADQGSPGQRATVHVRCTTAPDCHSGTSVITVTVESSVALPMAPAIFDNDLASFAITTSHTVPIGQYVNTTGQARGRTRGDDGAHES